jgi:hypothetical protein
VAGVKVFLYDSATGTEVGVVTTDAAGRYRFDTYPPGTYKVQFRGVPTYVNIWSGGQPTKATATPVTTTGGATITLDQTIAPV